MKTLILSFIALALVFAALGTVVYLNQSDSVGIDQNMEMNGTSTPTGVTSTPETTSTPPTIPPAGGGTQGDTLTLAALQQEQSRLDEINASPANMKIDPDVYPRRLGTYKGREVIEIYFCSDVCPNYGYVSIVYKDVTTRESCARIGGRDIVDPAWGGYIGCSPLLQPTKRPV